MTESLKRYSEFSPTRFDRNIPIEGREQWIVAPCSVNRDSRALELSNWKVQLERLGGESDTVEIHRFGHWGPGWFEIVLIDPSNKKAVESCVRMHETLSDYPVLCYDSFSEEEYEEACGMWQNCYNNNERIEFMKEHREEFSFNSFADMLSCAKGKHYCGSVERMVEP